MNKVLIKDANGESVPAFCPGATIKLVLTGASVASAVVNATDNQLIRVVATAAMNITVGSAPTATNSDMYLPAACVEYYIIPANTKVAAIGTGDVYITLHTN
jgi:hypothetical protein